MFSVSSAHGDKVHIFVHTETFTNIAASSLLSLWYVYSPTTISISFTTFQSVDMQLLFLYIFGERFKDHLKEPSSIHQHSMSTGHPTTQHNFQIIGREGHGIARIIKESIYIRVNNPTLNRNIGKFNLYHTWDRVLLNTSDLKKRHAQDIGHTQNTQHNSLTPLNQTNALISLSQPNTPMQFSTGSMKCAQRTPLFEHAHRTS